jgi:hypothetical protein
MTLSKPPPSKTAFQESLKERRFLIAVFSLSAISNAIPWFLALPAS